MNFPFLETRPEPRYRSTFINCGNCRLGLLTLIGPPAHSSSYGIPLADQHRYYCPFCGYQKRALPIKSGLRDIFDPSDVETMILAYHRGLGLAEIAEIMHSEKSVIKRYLLNAGVKLRPRGSGNWKRTHSEEHDQIDVIDFLYTGLGMSSAEVGKRLGLAATTVIYRMERHGIPRRENSEAVRLSWKHIKMNHEEGIHNDRSAQASDPHKLSGTSH